MIGNESTLSVELEREMDAEAEKIFGTATDSSQIPINEESRRKLASLSPDWINYETDEIGNPMAWVILFPTEQKLARKFISGEISEQELLALSQPQIACSALYLCAAVTMPKYRRQGLALKLFKRAITNIPKTANCFLFAWPTSSEGQALAHRVGAELNMKLHLREGRN